MANIVTADEIHMGPWIISVKDDGLYATQKSSNITTKIQLIDLRKGEIPPEPK